MFLLLTDGLSCKYMSISLLIVKDPLVSFGPSKMSKADFLGFLCAGMTPSHHHYLFVNLWELTVLHFQWKDFDH